MSHQSLVAHNNGDCGGSPETCYYCSREEKNTLGSCGCTDYHMADCPILTAPFEFDSVEYREYEGDFE